MAVYDINRILVPDAPPEYEDHNRNPLPWRTPYRTRRVPVAQDLMWEKFPIQDPVFCGLGERPVEFPEIELTYDTNTTRAEAPRCYRCDAEIGLADYSVQHREDIFSMARTDPQIAPKLKAMLDRRLRLRENPFPQERPACLDDLVFLPANLSRLVIDPYREACRIGWRLGERLELDIPFFVAGFDAASEELKVAVDRGLVAAGAAYLGATRPGPNAPWLQVCEPGRDAPSHDAAGVVYRVGERWHPMPTARARAEQLVGLLLASRRDLEDAIVYALERGFDLLVLDGTGALGGEWPELRAAPDLALVHDALGPCDAGRRRRRSTSPGSVARARVPTRPSSSASAGRVARTLRGLAVADAPTALNLLSPHEVAHFVKQSGRHTNPRGLGHAWSLVSRGVERFQAMTLHVADLPDIVSNIALSGRFAC